MTARKEPVLKCTSISSRWILTSIVSKFACSVCAKLMNGISVWAVCLSQTLPSNTIYICRYIGFEVSEFPVLVSKVRQFSLLYFLKLAYYVVSACSCLSNFLVFYFSIVQQTISASLYRWTDGNVACQQINIHIIT